MCVCAKYNQHSKKKKTTLRNIVYSWTNTISTGGKNATLQPPGAGSLSRLPEQNPLLEAPVESETMWFSFPWCWTLSAWNHLVRRTQKETYTSIYVSVFAGHGHLVSSQCAATVRMLLWMFSHVSLHMCLLCRFSGSTCLVEQSLGQRACVAPVLLGNATLFSKSLNSSP